MSLPANPDEPDVTPPATDHVGGDVPEVVVLMGMTGSGKSTFVSRLTGHEQDQVGVGHGLGSSVSATVFFPLLHR